MGPLHFLRISLYRAELCSVSGVWHNGPNKHLCLEDGETPPWTLLSPNLYVCESIYMCVCVCVFIFIYVCMYIKSGGLPGGSHVTESACNARDPGSIPGLGRSLEEKMAPHSTVLAWRIPWTEEPGGYSP